MVHWTLMCAFSVLAGLVVAETVVNICHRPSGTPAPPPGQKNAHTNTLLRPGSRRIATRRPASGETDSLSLR